jgi:hypothetical protein
MMDKKRRNLLLICAAIFLVFTIARSFVITALRSGLARQQAIQKPSPRPASALNPANTPNAADAPLANLSGVWRAHGEVAGGRGMCDMRLELKQADPAHYSGYSSFSCMNNAAIASPKDANVIANLLNHINPDAAILTGTVEAGAIHLHANKNIGTDINGCGVTDLTVTPFGASAVAAEWQEGKCAGGNLLMEREPR